MTTSPSTFRRILARRLAANILIVGALICAVIIGQATQETVMAERPAVTDSAAALIAANDCWTDEAPANVVPGHVVVTVGGETRLGGERMVSKALEQIFDGADHGLTVRGFCR